MPPQTRPGRPRGWRPYPRQNDGARGPNKSRNSKLPNKVEHEQRSTNEPPASGLDVSGPAVLTSVAENRQLRKVIQQQLLSNEQLIKSNEQVKDLAVKLGNKHESVKKLIAELKSRKVMHVDEERGDNVESRRKRVKRSTPSPASSPDYSPSPGNKNRETKNASTEPKKRKLQCLTRSRSPQSNPSGDTVILD